MKAPKPITAEKRVSMLAPSPLRADLARLLYCVETVAVLAGSDGDAALTQDIEATARLIGQVSAILTTRAAQYREATAKGGK